MNLDIAVYSTEEICNTLSEYNQEYNKMHDVENKFKATSEYDEIYEDIKSGMKYDMIFIDINIDKAEDLMYYIRNELTDRETAIVFISDTNSIPSRFIKYIPFGCTGVPIIYEDLKAVTDRFISMNFDSARLFEYEHMRRHYRIDTAKILYINRGKRKIKIHKRNEVIECSGSIQDCLDMECLKNFVHIHYSYIVNPLHIKKLMQDHVILNGDIRLPVSRQGAKELRDIVIVK